MAPLRQSTYHGGGGTTAVSSPEHPQGQTGTSHEMEKLEHEFQKLQLKKNKQRQTMTRLGNDIDCWKQEEERESLALDARLVQLMNELRQTRKEHAKVKQEWDAMMEGKKHTLKRRPAVSSRYNRHGHHHFHVGLMLPAKPYVEQQARDGTCTRLYEAKPAGSTPSQDFRQQLPSSAPASPSLGAYLDKNQEPSSHSCASVTTHETLFSTVSFSQFLMGLETESCSTTHSQMRHVQSSSRRKKRRGSLTRGLQNVLIRLDEEKQHE